MSRHLLKLRRLSAVVALTALLAAGCTSIQLNTESLDTAAEAISAAQELEPGAQTQRFLLKAATRFQERDEHDKARELLRSDAFSEPVDEIADQYLLLSMASAVALEDARWASSLAAEIPPEQYQEYPADLQAKSIRLQSDLYELAGQYLKAAQLLMEIDPELVESDQQTVNDRIWQALKKTPDSDLEQAAVSAIGFENQGWFELAATLRQPGMTLAEQGRAVRRWQFNWIGHPGTQALPSELNLMATVLEQRPENIVLALPLSGPLAAAGNMVREGFLAAYYASGEPQEGMTNREGSAAGDNEESPVSVNAGPDDTRIRIVDTNGRDFGELLRELAEDKPDLIIGPLAKDAVSQLAQQQSLPVPVLALNYAPDDSSAPAELFQFGLSVEDEARQIAEKVVEEGQERVLALVPRGDWGDRIADALSKRLEEQGGVILDISRYADTDNLRDVSADLLGINISRERAIDIEQTMGLNVEFEPRRRQDAEAIIMVAEPVIARQFKPLFSYYYAGNVPVYSPSIIYSGRSQPDRDRDVNGVYFTDVPWILDRDTPFRKDAYEEFENLDGPLGRLFAMGADAWNLSTQLPLMQQVADSRIGGHTGELRLDRNRRVHRTQVWGVFQDGEPELVSEVTEDSGSDNGESEADIN